MLSKKELLLKIDESGYSTHIWNNFPKQILFLEGCQLSNDFLPKFRVESRRLSSVFDGDVEQKRVTTRNDVFGDDGCKTSLFKNFVARVKALFTQAATVAGDDDFKNNWNISIEITFSNLSKLAFDPFE
jgi:hypothetical protein